MGLSVVAFLQPGWADWEAGPVLAGLRAFLGAEVIVATPDGGPSASIGGMQVLADCAFAEVEPYPDQMLLLVGAETWLDYRNARFLALLRRAAAEGGTVAGICAGTLPLAQAGLFAGRAHTSNSRAFLAGHAGAYAGAGGYRDVPHAVRDGRIVSAPGAAPNTFAAEVFRLCGPAGEAAAAAYEEMSRAEWSTRLARAG